MSCQFSPQGRHISAKNIAQKSLLVCTGKVFSIYCLFLLVIFLCLSLFQTFFSPCSRLFVVCLHLSLTFLSSVFNVSFPGVGSAYVEQPPFLTGAQESPKTLQCTLKQTSCNWMYWYRHQDGRELEGLFNSVGDGPGTNFTAEPMTALRSNTKWELTWTKLSRSDSAVYYCACSTAQ